MRAFIVLAILSGASMASAECRLMAEFYGVPVEVEVPGRAPIPASFRTQLVELLPSDSVDGIRFRPIGPVELVARLPSDNPVIAEVVTPEGSSLWSGPIQLHFGALLRVERVTDAGLFGFIRIASGVTARIGPLSCTGLRVITDAELLDSTGWPLDGELTHVDARLAGPRVRLYRDGVAALVHVREPLEVARLERRGHRFRVRRDFTSGVTLDGWARAADVTLLERKALEQEFHLRELTLRGTGRSICGGSWSRPVWVRQGVLALVRDGPNGAPWATIRPGTPLRATRTRSGYVLNELPGMKRDCDLEERAWLGASDVVEEP